MDFIQDLSRHKVFPSLILSNKVQEFTGKRTLEYPTISLFPHPRVNYFPNRPWSTPKSILYVLFEELHGLFIPFSQSYLLFERLYGQCISFLSLLGIEQRHSGIVLMNLIGNF